jgi:hypothetical protein
MARTHFVQQSTRWFKIGFWFDRKRRGSLDPLELQFRQVSGPAPSPKIMKYREIFFIYGGGGPSV